MPKPIVCLSEQLRQFAEIFRSCFSQRQWKYFVMVLLGLIECEERKTLSGLLRVIGEQVSLAGLSRFLNKWNWSPAEVAQSWLLHFRQRMEPLVRSEHRRLKAQQPKRIGRPKQTVVTGFLIFDDSVHSKPKGQKMGGLGYHYSNTEHRVVAGHCLFTGLYVLLGQRCPLEPKMYCQKNICEQEKRSFQSKVALAVEELETFEPVPDTQTHVLIDSWYHCQQVRRAAQKRGWQLSGALKSNRVIRLIAEDGTRTWIKLSAYAAGRTQEDWSEVTWPSAEGGQKMYAHLVVTWIRKLGPTLLLITCHDPDEPLKTIRYWSSTVLDLDAQTLVDILAVRWEVETFFEYEKDLLGSDHYQVMTRQAVLRFWTLTTCLLCFLDEQRIQFEDQTLTCGDVRRMVQNDHRQNLLLWLETRFRDGLSVEQIRCQLALCDS
jgi:hypothetical protein